MSGTGMRGTRASGAGTVGALRRLGALARDGVRATRECITSPADAWLAARMAAWALVLPLLKRVVPLPRLVQLMVVPPKGADRDTARDTARERRVVALSRLLYAPLVRADIGCLQRSLLAYRFLGAAGARPSLLVGMRREGGEMHGHAWVTVDGEPAGEPAAWVGQFSPVLVFGSEGARAAAPTTNPVATP